MALVHSFYWGLWLISISDQLLGTFSLDSAVASYTSTNWRRLPHYQCIERGTPSRRVWLGEHTSTEKLWSKELLWKLETVSGILISCFHYDDVIMTMLASQITSLTVVYSIVYSGVNQGKHQSSASLAFVREIHRGPVNFPHKWPVTRKMFPFDDVIMLIRSGATRQRIH